MTKFLVIALFGVAAAVTWVLWHLWKQQEKPTGTDAPQVTPQEVLEEKPLDIEEQPQSVSVQEAESCPAPIESSELTPESPASGDTPSQPRGEISDDRPPSDIPPDSEIEQSKPPSLVVRPRPKAPQEFPYRPRGEKTSKPRTTSNIAPESRGGGQMDVKDTRPPVEHPKRVGSGPQLRLVCFKGNDRMWRIAVELPEDYLATGDIGICQDQQSLEPVAFNENRWLLPRLNGTIVAAESGKGGQHWQLEISGNRYLLFKLLEEDEVEEGRLVNVSSRGQYLVFSPEDWLMPDWSGTHRAGSIGTLPAARWLKGEPQARQHLSAPKELGADSVAVAVDRSETKYSETL